MNAPQSVSDIDRSLRRSLRGMHRARWFSVTAVALLLVACIAVLGWMTVSQVRTISSQQQRLDASCEFYGVIASLAMAPPAASPKPGRALVELVTSSRAAYTGQGCGSLPPPAGNLRYWAAYYKLPLR